jgi:NAD(P)H-nitrite reductase large subunit
MMSVDRCVCHRVTFDRLLEETTRVGRDISALKKATGCCTGCGMCKPYVIMMLRTGRTVFPLLSAAAASRIIAEWHHEQELIAAGRDSATAPHIT